MLPFGRSWNMSVSSDRQRSTRVVYWNELELYIEVYFSICHTHLVIENLHVSVDGKAILRGVNLVLKYRRDACVDGPKRFGQKHAWAWRSWAIPITTSPKDRSRFDGEDVLRMEADERARAGIFMAFQRPVAVPGVKMADFLRHATTNVRRPDRKEGEELIPMREFRKELKVKNGTAQDGSRVRAPLRQRWFFGRRNEAGRDS